jgi:hypothetical protein
LTTSAATTKNATLTTTNKRSDKGVHSQHQATVFGHPEVFTPGPG